MQFTRQANSTEFSLLYPGYPLLSSANIVFHIFWDHKSEASHMETHQIWSLEYGNVFGWCNVCANLRSIICWDVCVYVCVCVCQCEPLKVSSSVSLYVCVYMLEIKSAKACCMYAIHCLKQNDVILQMLAVLHTMRRRQWSTERDLGHYEQEKLLHFHFFCASTILL